MNRKIKITKIAASIVISLILLSCDQDFPISENGDLPDLGPSPMVIVNDEIDGTPVVVAASKSKDILVAFKRTVDGEILDFYATPAEPPIAFMDESGTIWDIFGRAVSGKHKGKKLDNANSMVGFWFSFATFFPGLSIYPNNDPGPNEGEEINGSGDWKVPSNEIRDGGPGIDGIPAIENPKYVTAVDATHLNPDDLIVGFYDGSGYKAFPHKILDWHEIVNETDGENKYSIIYCPLTGTATAWSGNFSSGETTFGVSGLLYNSNIIPYDRDTRSYWSQIRNEAINGDQFGLEPVTMSVVETTWKNWKDMYPNSQVLSSETGYSRDYSNYPYGNYNDLNSDYLIFPVKFNDKRLKKKLRVLAVNINGKAKVYHFGLQ